jgi:hypothetical protein
LLFSLFTREPSRRGTKEGRKSGEAGRGPDSLIRQMSLFFFPSPQAAPKEATSSPAAKPQQASELEELLCAHPAVARAVLRVLAGVACPGSPGSGRADSAESLVGILCEMHASRGRLRELARHVAQREYEERERDISVWREKTELVALAQAALRLPRAVAWGARLADPVVKV